MDKTAACARFFRNVRRDKYLLLMLSLPILFFLLFSYVPMFGILMAFQDFKSGAGFFGSPWAGFKWFREFFNSIFCFRVIKNTFLLSFFNLLFTFPLPILFALLLNEVKSPRYKRIVQTVSYLPHFISTVIVVGMMTNFLSASDGIINNILANIGLKRVQFMIRPEWFRPLYIVSGVWQELGWSSIIYLAALSGVDPQLYEAALIDGANRLRLTWHITLPGIRPTIVTLLIMGVGGMFNVGFEKIILMYSPSIYDTADVISTYVYRRGIVDAQYSFGVAVGLFNSVIGFAFLWGANYLAKKTTDIGLW